MNSNVICAILRKQILTVITIMLAFQSCDQHMRTTWKKKSLFWAHGFRGHSSWPDNFTVLGPR